MTDDNTPDDDNNPPPAPTPPPNPPAPTPPPAPEPPKNDAPSREEFASLTAVVASLAESVAALVPSKKDSTPLDKGPWTHWGNRKDNNDSGN